MSQAGVGSRARPAQPQRDYSRTEYVFGKEALTRMQRASFLVVGLGGCGAETAKNLILTGSNRVGLLDWSLSRPEDLAANPFLSEDDVQKHRTRAEAVQPRLQELNPLCDVSVIGASAGGGCEAQVLEALKQFSVVCQCDLIYGAPEQQLPEAPALAAYCHAQGIPYILSTADGLAGRVFCDFGPSFVCADQDGETINDLSVSSIVIDELQDGWHVFVTTTEGHQLSDGYRVNVRDPLFHLVPSVASNASPDAACESVAELRSSEPLADALTPLLKSQDYRVRVTSYNVFEAEMICPQAKEKLASVLADAKAHGMEYNYFRGAYARRVREDVTLQFKEYAQAAEDPAFPDMVQDFSKLGRAQVLHAAYRYVTEHRAEASTLVSETWNQQCAAQFVERVVAAYGQSLGLKEGDPAPQEVAEVLQLFALTYAGSLTCTASVCGGWAAQECLKAASGKYMPIMQFLYFDAFEALPPAQSSYHPLKSAVSRVGDRYDGTRMLLGAKLMERIAASNLFIVGAGALGCELLKQFLLMGASTADGALLEVTDNDSIENSNLSRQFLFREGDIGKMKSEVAVDRCLTMNPGFHAKARCLRVGPETENVLDDAFWGAKDVIVNALDNVGARRYVDSRCVEYAKPLLESGTLGQKCNTQVVVPRLTETYGSQQDPEGDSAPICTIHNFPNTIVHCIAYANNEFKGIFENGPSELAKACERGLEQYALEIAEDESMVASRLTQLHLFAGAAAGRAPISSVQEYAAEFAFVLFQRYFNVTVHELLSTFPPGAKDKDGSPFWSAEKRPPHVILYDPEQEMHRELIQAAARICAEALGMDCGPSREGLQAREELYKLALDRAASLAAAGHSAGCPTVLCKEAISKRLTKELERPTAESVLRVLKSEWFLAGFISSALAAPAESREVRPRPVPFEKDDADNDHVAFMAAFSNLRAANYSIPQMTTEEIRRVAGNIIPAMITTTALVVGLVGFEFLKVLLWDSEDASARHPLGDYKCAFVNLALPLWQPTEPVEYRPHFVRTLARGLDSVDAIRKAEEESRSETCSRTTSAIFTEWDFIEFTGNPTLQEIISRVEADYNVSVDTVLLGTQILWCGWMAQSSNSSKRVNEFRAAGERRRLCLTVSAVDAQTGDDVELPLVRVK